MPKPTVNYADMTKGELKELCRERGIHWQGNPSHYLFWSALTNWDKEHEREWDKEHEREDDA